jgi:UDP-N-acetylmuramate dehydrogenase
VVAETEEGLIRALSWADESEVKVRFHLGDGYLARDGGVKGLSISLGGLGWGVSLIDNQIDVGGGYPAAALAEWVAREQLSPFEVVSGVASTVAEALRGGLFGDRVTGLRVLRGSKIRDINLEQLLDHHVVLRVFLVAVVDGDHQLTLVSPVAANGSRPGRVLKNLPKQQASDLVREAGLCGVRLRGAAIGTVEPNTILNLGGATASDISLLLRMMRDRIKAQSGVEVSAVIREFGER